VEVFHFRTQTGREVDIVLEDRKGRLVGIEIKSSASVDGSDFAGLRTLAEMAPDRFVRGIVLHTGAETVPFAKNMVAMPIGALWAGA
jgi:predicted AAA+ superfamily ATPase